MVTRTSTQLARVLLVGWTGLTCTGPKPAYFPDQPPADAGPSADTMAGAGGAGADPNPGSGGQAGAGQGGAAAGQGGQPDAGPGQGGGQSGAGQGGAGSVGSGQGGGAGSDASDGAGPSSDAAVNLNQGLVSRWRFDEFSIDTSTLTRRRVALSRESSRIVLPTRPKRTRPSAECPPS